MAQLVIRVDDALVEQIDHLIERGVVASRSDAVRRGLAGFLDAHRRRAVGEAIADGYRETPQVEGDPAWSDEATRRMIAEEPW